MNRIQSAVLPAALAASILIIFFVHSLPTFPGAALAGSAPVSVGPHLPGSESALADGFPPEQSCQVSARFPETILQWCSLISRHALDAGLEPDLVAALMLQESGGDPDAVSSNGAVGLLQVMPSDGPAAEFMCPNGPCFAGRPASAELLDPEFNLAFGTAMLADLESRTGSLRQALLHYGPTEVGYAYADTVIQIWQRYKASPAG